MSLLRSIEQRIEGLVEGLFGRAFRTHVQPVELARKLAKEMDDHRSVSVSRVYVPNEYSVYLSPSDREQFASYESSLADELREHLSDPNASRRHAEVRRDGTAFWIVDLGSTNGLEVNGKRTQRAKLSDGDRVTIGTTELVFAMEGT